MLRKTVSGFVCLTFLFTSLMSPAGAGGVNPFSLPKPGAMVHSSAAFVPVLLKGMTLDEANPFQFEFIIDNGHSGLAGEELKAESERLVKYFLASMTVPQNDLWVNLSPYEGERIIPDELARTELGRDLLAQDYLLKQFTASLIYPEDDLGQEFWDRVYAKAMERYGTTDIPVNTFNKVWILPESASVYENGRTVFIVDARLKVMLDEDYTARQSNADSDRLATAGMADADVEAASELSSKIFRDIVLPEIEREVNEGENFAPVRQIYHSLILAKWYKDVMKEGLLSKIYVDRNKVTGIESGETDVKDRVYRQYVEAYERGVFDYIKEDHDRLTRQPIPRKYFSGGISDNPDMATLSLGRDAIGDAAEGKISRLGLEIRPRGSDNAMLVRTEETSTGMRMTYYLPGESGSDVDVDAIVKNGDARRFDLDNYKAEIRSEGARRVVVIDVPLKEQDSKSPDSAMLVSGEGERDVLRLTVSGNPKRDGTDYDSYAHMVDSLEAMGYEIMKTGEPILKEGQPGSAFLVTVRTKSTKSTSWFQRLLRGRLLGVTAAEVGLLGQLDENPLTVTNGDIVSATELSFMDQITQAMLASPGYSLIGAAGVGATVFGAYKLYPMVFNNERKAKQLASGELVTNQETARKILTKFVAEQRVNGNLPVDLFEALLLSLPVSPQVKLAALDVWEQSDLHSDIVGNSLDLLREDGVVLENLLENPGSDKRFETLDGARMLKALVFVYRLGNNRLKDRAAQLLPLEILIKTASDDLDSPEQTVRERAIQTLARIGTGRVGEILVDHMDREDSSRNQVLLLKALVQGGGDRLEGFTKAQKLLRSENRFVASEALYAMLAIDSIRALPFLSTLLFNPESNYQDQGLDLQMREIALENIRQHQLLDDAELVGFFEELFDDGDETRKAQVFHLLNRFSLSRLTLPAQMIVRSIVNKGRQMESPLIQLARGEFLRAHPNLPTVVPIKAASDADSAQLTDGVSPMTEDARLAQSLKIFEEAGQRVESMLSPEGDIHPMLKAIRRNREEKRKTLFVYVPLHENSRVAWNVEMIQHMLIEALNDEGNTKAVYNHLNQIHMTIASPEIAEGQLSLNPVELQQKVIEEADGGAGFPVEITGVQLMPDGVITMELRHRSKLFVGLRESIARWGDQQDLPENHRGNVPEIYHSTIATLVEDSSLTRENLMDLEERLEAFDEALEANPIRVDVKEFRVAAFDKARRRIIDEPLSVPLKDNAQMSDLGGIDMNNIEVNRQGERMSFPTGDIPFDPALLPEVDGFEPVILYLTPVNSLLPLLGLQDAADERYVLNR